VTFAEREALYGPVLVAAFVSAGLPPEWGLAIAMQETRFNPDALNNTGGDLVRGGSRGLCQMSWKTALGLGYTGVPGDLFKPRTCADLAAKLCSELVRRWKTHDLSDIASGYNSGRRFTQAPASTIVYSKNVVAYAKHYEQSGRIMAAELIETNTVIA
jgi:soluble lytic murein transglycosylase-like protein